MAAEFKENTGGQLDTEAEAVAYTLSENARSNTLPV
jgi:hypothetical protein